MSILVALNHKTSYRYDRPVSHSPHDIRLRPAVHARTPILAYSLKVDPKPHFLNWLQDPVGNHVARVVFPENVNELSVEVDLIADLKVINPFDFFVEERAERYPFFYDDALREQLAPYLQRDFEGPLFQAWLRGVKTVPGMRTIDFLVDVNQRLQQDIEYRIRMQPGVQTCEETLAKRSGSCRDSAWLLVNILRHLGIAARFVSGYLIQLKPDVKPLEGPAGAVSDFTDLHAWAEAFVEGAGWIGLDPTSGLVASEGHIPLSCTAAPAHSSPILGRTEVCEVDFGFEMSVTRVAESPRVTKPYEDGQWRAICDLGEKVDRDLAAHDVRLTMGGEPTFVSADDRQGDEWHTEALGPTKKIYGDRLIKRLRERMAPGAFLHHGQGKWYGGEPLPRWAIACHWRKDGIPAWSEPGLIADESAPKGHTAADAKLFIEELARALGVSSHTILPAHEDVWHYLLQERRFPANIDPLTHDLDDSLERKRLAKVLSQGLGSVVGYALPLRPFSWGIQTVWETGRWFFRDETLYLIPGDSPMGFRLPLDSLPWETSPNRDASVLQDPFRTLPRLGDYHRQVADRRRAAPSSFRVQNPLSPRGNASSGPAAAGDFSNPDFWNVVRTALCVEPREGHLRVFMPPLGALECYLDLVASIEHTAKALGMPVFLEGYPPPDDPRLRSFRITPDPGVLEVNIPPAENWGELLANTHILFEEARNVRLSTEKFMVDGRHGGTGGGNHVTLGSGLPAGSPFLRRPDLLKSLIGYWQNHPSLSYLFSGLFIGPTSQAPRVDEARHEALYELSIAFQQISEGIVPQPWLVDRYLRNLLTDVTGNTHRTEFCIDKLYSPEGPAGRQGIVELRAFEMPPHPSMFMVQMLVVRALVAKFWRNPHQGDLVRWGTELHDRFLLPRFVENDFRDVLADLRADGYGFGDDWFAPFFEFRFPHLGSVSSNGIHLELRQAIEPWHVMGEETSSWGTSRFVDSSLERLQVRVRGVHGARHVVTCNGQRLPLHPTGVNGEFVAGVRYRAWNPSSALHPTLPVNTPLVFDVIDQWSKRSIGGCTYHAAHPGGRSFDTFPVNAAEAESRRGARFFQNGHTPGTVEAPALALNPDYPFTLDLRLRPRDLALQTEHPYNRKS